MGPTATAPHGNGEPDGFDGLGRRGAYERLLASEWALADASVDEFLRRAAWREHLFHQIRFHSPAAAKRALVLFDAGPDQLGAPRIGHLATLLVLALRAEQEGSALLRGVMQAPEVLLDGEVSKTAVLALLEARSLMLASRELLERLQIVVKASAVALSDLWLVGGPALRALTLGTPLEHAPHLEIDEHIMESGRKLQFTIRRAGQQSRTLRVDLPTPRLCAALLQDPFESVSAPTALVLGAIEAGHGLRFVQSGQRLLVRRRDGALLVWAPTGGVGRTPRPEVMELEPDHQLVAAGWWRGGIVAITRHGPTAWLWGVPQARQKVALSGDQVPKASERLSHAALQIVGGSVVFRDGDGALFSLQRKTLHLTRRSFHVADLIEIGDDTTVALARRPQLPWGVLELIGHEPRWLEDVDVASGGFILPWRGQAKTLQLLIAEPRDNGLWRLRHHSWTATEHRTRPSTDLSPWKGSIVCGVGYIDRECPALLLLEADRRALGWAGRGGAVRFPIASAEIVDVATSRHGMRVAYLTRAGEVVVVNAGGRALMRVLSS
ncbi:MAG: hypothetical protein HY898_35020 [Deltaproteobacteria bacterium]|nr:hypothetical protein [Deltaproteobacteria bacterium]